MLLALVAPALALSSGQTGSSTTGCVSCHGSAADADVTGDLSTTSTTVAPSSALTVTFTVSSTDSTHEIGGLNVSASAGTLTAGTGTVNRGGEITHTRDQHFSGGRATWAFTWTAPAAEGTYTLSSAGLAGNHNHSESGDGWDLDTVLITVDDGCDDLDRDGYEACDDGLGADCDDGDASVRPGATETCDAVDQDCDGVVDDHPTDGTPMYADADGDTFGDPDAPDATCSAVPDAGYVFDAQDCDDGDDTIHPDADEVCDGADNDCDDATDGATSVDAATFWTDADADGFGDPASPVLDCSLPIGASANAEDCDDTRGAVSPDAAEVCDPLDTDEDCDSAADDADMDATGETTFYQDNDGDTYGGTVTTDACSAPSGYVAIAGDCDDDDTAFNPAAAEICTDPTDYNCDGSTGYVDGDGDSFAACLDCDDSSATSYDGAPETCNGADDDCDGTVDEADAVDAAVWFVDADLDGYGATAAAVVSCDQPSGYADNADDCDDADTGARPDAPEVWYDGVDQDCDGADDDQDGDGVARADDCDDTVATTRPGAEDAPYDGLDADCAGDSDSDADHDGHDSETYGGDDCDDADATVFPGAMDEPYDGLINDCDAADENDLDGDGADLAEDCDDANSAIGPDAEEVWYDGIDQDCDGNDADQDADGVTYGVDCNDTDPLLTLDCDPTDDDEGDTSPIDPPADEGCGCASGGEAGFALAVLAFGLVGRRRGRRRAG
jgi:MYXO-CTERM domain-containing protein